MTNHSFRFNYCFAYSLLFLIACSSKSNDQNVEVIHIDKAKAEILSKIVEDIEYVVLENPNKPFVKADKLFVFDGGIILADYWSNHTLLRYDQNGKFLNPIGRYGEGPGEYVQITDVDFDDKSRNLIIISRNHLITYSIDGVFIDEIPLKNRPTNFLKLDGNSYLFYFPEVLASELRSGIDQAILYNFCPDTDVMTPLLNPIFPGSLNFIGDKNNLLKIGDSVIFSSTYSDTVYYISNNAVYKKVYLDFGSAQNDLSKMYGLSHNDRRDYVNSDVFNYIVIHVPHLFGNSRFLTSAFRKRTGFDFFLYDMKEKIPYVSSKTVNDVDGGLGFGIIKGMDENYFYAYFEPEEILQHYEKNIDQLKDQDNNFTKLARQINRDDFLILAKYKLKK
ncbi:6-bladed beta-propeller [Aquiflexum sp. TKW24L]|uniref:6-bladed beta-propeller n=1 Tax=Aquiflexum sp. TKW24L TaxID=2942212 RepID=UPI0020BF7C83|nr:6-bladed beta-propeller [Aquiflexum sp. TKW24L]MCL6259735.1 6-bladed beta-propeller [Aquiflexum sp. TKW24L]